MSAAESLIWITDSVAIPIAELSIQFVRSSGPGGQHVNKTSTQADLTFDLAHSPSFSPADREWLMGRLASKLDSEGQIRVTAQEHRSQARNRKAAIEKLQTMLAEAIKRPKKRKKTKPSKAAREKRLNSKKKDSEKKKLRTERF